MAESNTTADLELVVSDSEVTMTKRRRDVALEAAWEIEKLAEILRESTPLREDDMFYAVRGISARVRELTCIIMSAIDDKMNSTPSLWAKLNVKHESQFI